MPTTRLRPSASVSTGSWTGAFPGNINDNSDATSVFNTDGDDGFEQNFDDLPPQATTVSGMTETMRHSRSAAPVELKQFIKHAGNTTNGSVIAPAGAIADTSETLAMPGGVGISVAVVNAMTGGCVSSAGIPTEEVYVYDIWWDVTWESANGGFLFLLGLSGAMLSFGEMPRLAAAAFARDGRTRVLPSEFKKAYEELRAHLHPKFFDLAVIR